MLSNQLVQDELGLSDEQRADVAALLDELAALGRATARELRAGRGPGSRDEPAAVVNLIGERSQGLEKRAVEVLSSEQAARLRQVHLQGKGAWAFFDPVVQEALGVDEQLNVKAELVVAASEAECQKVAADARAGHLSMDEAIARVDELRRQACREVLALLDEEQGAELKRLLGAPAPFDPSKLRYRVVLGGEVPPGD
jgi:hypothetical protein